MESLKEADMKDADFDEYRGRTRIVDRTADPREFFSVSPLAKLVSTERRGLVSRRMDELRTHLKTYLTIGEYVFLSEILGREWHKKLYFPDLEDVENVQGYVNEKVKDVKERLNILMEATSGLTDPRKMAMYLSAKPYFLFTEQETIETYRKVLSNGAGFPYQFFSHDDGRRSGLVIRYMYEIMMGLKPEKIFEKATRKDFREQKLEWLLNSRFRGSVQDAIRSAYPQSKYPNLYRSRSTDAPVTYNTKSLGGLSHLVASLDDIFTQEQPKSTQNKK